jgi:ISXO2 transposase-like protein/transposase-like zinc ribbon protein
VPADIFQREHLPFPGSLPEFQRLFPHDAACAAYLEAIRWQHGFVCVWCGERGEPFRFANRPQVLRCRRCRKDNALTAGTVMERTHTPLSVWFWGAYLASSLTPGLSAVQFQRQLGIGRYETAFQILHKLRAGMVRPDRDQIGGIAGEHVEVDETWIGGATRGGGKGVHDQTLVIGAVEVKQRKPKKGAKPRRGGRYAGRIRLDVVPDRSALSLTSFIQNAVQPGTMIITDAAPSYATLGKLGYEHLPVVEAGNPAVAEEFLPIVHLIFSNLKSWLQGCHHGVSPQHLQAYLNEFTFRFNRRFYPFNAFRSLLGIGSEAPAPTYEGLYSGSWQHANCSSHGC